MAETVKGGRYVGEDGRWYDAEGRLIEDAPTAEAVGEQTTPEAALLPAPDPELAPPASKGRKRS